MPEASTGRAGNAGGSAGGGSGEHGFPDSLPGHVRELILSILARGVFDRMGAIQMARSLMAIAHDNGRTLLVVNMQPEENPGAGYGVITDVQIGAYSPDRVEWSSTGGDWRTGAPPEGGGRR